MQTALTPQQITEYQDNGFINIKEFLSAQEVAELKGSVVETVEEMGKKKVSAGGSDMQEEDDYFSRTLTQRLNLWRLNDTVKSYMLNAKLGKMLCELAGVESMRVWHDQALIKEPFGNPTAWHLDNPYWSFYSQNSISIWIALEDATFENGCMWFSPGTHKLASHDNVGITPDIGGLFRVYPKMGEIDPVPVPMKAGDCSFHNGLTAHGAGANMTRGRRVAMTCAYMPGGSTFNGQQNILSTEYYNSLKQGDVLENDDWNPQVYPVS